MSPIAIGVLALSMSVDAFVAALGKGAKSGAGTEGGSEGGNRPSLGFALRTGAIFGAVEAVTPLIGWALGQSASPFIAAFDHWIAFVLLVAVGLHMLVQACRPRGVGYAVTGRVSVWMTLATAFGTSIDAMVVGVSLAFLDVNILVVAAAIGCATLVTSTSGVLLGRFIGQRHGRIAEGTGGSILIALGSVILVQHLTAG
ncbi:manganese efflux pump MntP family protein [Phaeobacter sp. J2-8]|uniref:manganese efflux pump MntP n=1 Tax=Phaeobacter sp. J2-8 TaxID=2931394 RepID=UPI001FD23D26|nr:manganese efflux pump MntP family protein [Phaeobacter sp. J2-8]MCJ7874626.1 manganese efflux pump MntP family protein [Phaeobacter sp. J2-8]